MRTTSSRVVIASLAAVLFASVGTVGCGDDDGDKSAEEAAARQRVIERQLAEQQRQAKRALRQAKQEAAAARRQAEQARQAAERAQAQASSAPPAPAPAPEAEPTPAPSSSCDPSYSGCVPTYPPDVDCADVGGPVQVYGSDPHGLDADGDGSACET